MNPQHKKAAHWIQKGIFDDLRSFGDFEAKVNPVVEEKDRGDLFEIFIEGYLATQSITQWKQHWVVGEIPLAIREKYNLPKSQGDGTGIDGIYETHDGTHVAYQVKYRKAKHLTFAEVSPFLGITEKFSDRVIFTNAKSLADNAVARTRWYSGDIFNDLSAGQLSQIEAWLKEKPVPIVRATPDPSYQVQALADIDKTFQSHNRATVVMACGTGKTLVALWAAEQSKPKTVLVLLPSLTLLQQTLKEWSQQTSWGSKFNYLCVCSDQTVGLKNDDININKSEVGFRVDTDPAIVRAFLERKTDDTKVIFSTYHSTVAVAEGSKGLPPFDLGIFDEAHKTTGRTKSGEESYFTYALSDEWVHIKKRLFLTATPRHIDIRHRDKEGEFKVQSMDDEAIYGPRSHTLSFGAAAQKGIICPYKVIISLIDKQMVDDFTRKNGITLVSGDEIGARWVSNLIALEQAVEKVAAKKIITFHSRVNSAKEFAKNEPRGIAHYLKDYEVRHVNGSQNSGERDQLIRAFATSTNGLITNARCLTEGVNIPAVDMVAFIDPRQSRVDIAQAVGRAMRKPRGVTTKTVGYVMVPLFAGMGGEGLDDAIKTEKFDVVADVINSLQEHDEELVDIIRELKQNKGEGKVFNPKRLREKLEFIGPVVGLDELVQSISVAITDKLGRSWDESYGRLVKYKDREGHCRVPASHTTEDGYRLGNWVSTQRYGEADLTEDRRRRLNELGFVWDSLADQWEQGYSALKKYREREGHCRVPQLTTEDGYRLGQWVAVQRTHRDQLTEDRKHRLKELGFVWDPLADQWEQGYIALKKYREREGHCRVPARTTEDGYPLGGWVRSQRTHRDQLTEEQHQRLIELDFVFDPLADDWEQGYSALKKFKDREGHCRVPQTTTEDGYRLGQWVSAQRTKDAELTDDRRRRLNELGFVWDSLADQWEQGYSALKKFKEREGNCRVPLKHTTEDGYRLGAWVNRQRNDEAKLTEDRRCRLNELGFVWDDLAEQWEEGYVALKKFKDREGHCRVSRAHIEDGYRLGEWVKALRSKKASGKLTEDRLRRLNELGFVWDPLADQWEQGYSALKKYREREGHCRVPASHTTEDGYRLGQWVSIQRKNQDQLTEDRRRRLNELGFVWDPLADQWEQGYSALKKFKDREGHCRVPASHTTEDGYRLGNWVYTQRATEADLTEDRRRRLNELGFVWDPLADDWEQGYSALKKFKDREGHCRVPQTTTEDGYPLGNWVSNKRAKDSKLTEDRRRRLNELGFVWDPLADQWEQGYIALKKYREREGHCRVPQLTTEDGYRLGAWVSNQRAKEADLTEDRRRRLDELGFVWRVLKS